MPSPIDQLTHQAEIVAVDVEPSQAEGQALAEVEAVTEHIGAGVTPPRRANRWQRGHTDPT
jgi:hypothetical protein